MKIINIQKPDYEEVITFRKDFFGIKFYYRRYISGIWIEETCQGKSVVTNTAQLEKLYQEYKKNEN